MSRSNSPESKLRNNINRLSRVQTVPYFEGRANPDFRFFVLNVLTRFAQAVEAYEDRGGKPPRFVIGVPGLPGNGKTYLMEGINTTISDWGGPRIRNLLKDEAEGWFVHKTWEDDGLAAAREVGIIDTGPSRPASAEGLIGANMLFQDRIVKATQTHLFTTVEAPIVGAILADPNETDLAKKWKGRMMGNEALRNLHLGIGPFREVGEGFGLESFAAGVCGGPELEIFTNYRGEIKDSKTLGEARRRVRKYGKPGPNNAEELEAMQMDGASPEQMKIINKVTWDIMRDLEYKGEIQLLDQGRFTERYNASVKAKIGMDRSFEAFMRYSTGILMRYIFEKDFVLTEERYCIGYNAPTFEDLGIDVRKQTALRNYFAIVQSMRPI